MRRILAAASFVLLGLPVALGPVASGHDNHLEFKWRAPEEKADVSGQSVQIQARVRFRDKVDHWTVEVLGAEGDETLPSFGKVCEGTGEAERTVEVNCIWNTTVYRDGKLTWNDTYRLRVTAWNGEGRPEAEPKDPDQNQDPAEGQGETTEPPAEDSPGPQDQEPAGEAHVAPERIVTVNNPPQPTSNVELAFAEETSQVNLTWDANPEPDVAGYLVEERFESGDWSLVAKPTTTEWSTRLTKNGTYRYRVAAVRYVGSSERLNPGPFSEPQSGLRKVKVDAEDRPTPSPEPRTAAASEKPPEPGAASSTTTTSKAQSEPVGSVAVTYEGVAPGQPGFPAPAAGSAPGAPGGAAVPGQPRPVVSPIQPGKPGSVQTRYGTPRALPRPVPPEEAFNPNFSLTLPYAAELPAEILAPPPEPPRLLTMTIFETDKEQERVVIGVLAGGLLFFVVSMQAVYLNRRPRWLGYDLAASDWD